MSGGRRTKKGVGFRDSDRGTRRVISGHIMCTSIISTLCNMYTSKCDIGPDTSLSSRSFESCDEVPDRPEAIIDEYASVVGDVIA
jgi:hypothetical protein